MAIEHVSGIVPKTQNWFSARALYMLGFNTRLRQSLYPEHFIGQVGTPSKKPPEDRRAEAKLAARAREIRGDNVIAFSPVAAGRHAWQRKELRREAAILIADMPDLPEVVKARKAKPASVGKQPAIYTVLPHPAGGHGVYDAGASCIAGPYPAVKTANRRAKQLNGG